MSQNQNGGKNCSKHIVFKIPKYFHDQSQFDLQLNSKFYFLSLQNVIFQTQFKWILQLFQFVQRQSLVLIICAISLYNFFYFRISLTNKANSHRVHFWSWIKFLRVLSLFGFLWLTRESCIIQTFWSSWKECQDL